MKSCGARSSGDVVRRSLGTLWEMLRDALAVGAKWFGKSFGRWLDGSAVGSFLRSVGRAFVQESKELYQKPPSGVSAYLPIDRR